MPMARVKWFSLEKGYGFLTPEDEAGDDVFVHITAVEKSGISSLREGDTVSYELAENPKNGKMAATNLKLL